MFPCSSSQLSGLMPSCNILTYTALVGMIHSTSTLLVHLPLTPPVSLTLRLAISCALSVFPSLPLSAPPPPRPAGRDVFGVRGVSPVLSQPDRYCRTVAENRSTPSRIGNCHIPECFPRPWETNTWKSNPASHCGCVAKAAVYWGLCFMNVSESVLCRITLLGTNHGESRRECWNVSDLSEG